MNFDFFDFIDCSGWDGKITIGTPSTSKTWTLKTVNAPKATLETDVKSNSFFDDEMLDYLLGDIMKQKAKQGEEEIKKAAEDKKKKEIKNFANSIDHVLFNKPWTIVFWKNGDITRVKCQKGDTYDAEKGFAIAVIKHMFGDTPYFNTIFKKWVDEEGK